MKIDIVAKIDEKKKQNHPFCVFLTKNGGKMEETLFLKDYEGNGVYFTANKTKVKLPNAFYLASKSNPCIGSKYECYGIVRRIYPEQTHNVGVEWFNGSENSYRGRELIAFSDGPTGPNEAFRFQRGGRINPKEGYYNWSEVEWKTKD